MGHKEKIDAINESYNKWLIAFRLKGIVYYTVWGADSTDNNNDKLWIDNHQRIILFSDPKKLINTIITMSVSIFDIGNVKNWALAQRDNDFFNR